MTRIDSDEKFEAASGGDRFGKTDLNVCGGRSLCVCGGGEVMKNGFKIQTNVLKRSFPFSFNRFKKKNGAGWTLRSMAASPCRCQERVVAPSGTPVSATTSSSGGSPSAFFTHGRIRVRSLKADQALWVHSTGGRPATNAQSQLGRKQTQSIKQLYVTFDIGAIKQSTFA